MGKRNITSRIFILNATLKWIVSLTPPAFYHRGNIPSQPPVMHWTRVDVYIWFSLLELMQDIWMDNKEKDKNTYGCALVFEIVLYSYWWVPKFLSTLKMAAVISAAMTVSIYNTITLWHNPEDKRTNHKSKFSNFTTQKYMGLIYIQAGYELVISASEAPKQPGHNRTLSLTIPECLGGFWTVG